MLKSEKGVSRVELAIIVCVIIIVAVCAVFLSIGEDGISIIEKNEQVENVIENENSNNEVNNEQVNSEQQNEVIDDTVYRQ